MGLGTMWGEQTGAEDARRGGLHLGSRRSASTATIVNAYIIATKD